MLFFFCEFISTFNIAVLSRYWYFLLLLFSFFLFVYVLDSRQKQLTSYDCFVFAISSHGMELVQKDERGNNVHQHAIKMFDDQFVYTSNILDHFNDKNCRALKNKPKLFFIQVWFSTLGVTSRNSYFALWSFEMVDCYYHFSYTFLKFSKGRYFIVCLIVYFFRTLIKDNVCIGSIPFIV